MQTEMRLQAAEAGQAIISLSVPADKANAVADVIRSVLALAGHKVRRINSDGEEVVSSAEVFPDASPAMALAGFGEKWNGHNRNWLKSLAQRKTVFPTWKAANGLFP